MRAHRSATLVAALAATAILALAACASDAEPEPSAPAPQPSTSATPSPSPAETPLPYEQPAEAEGDLARAEHAIVDGVPTTPSIAIAPMVADAPVAIEGQCTGGESMTFRLERAVEGDPDERLLIEGEIARDSPVAQLSTITSPYAGPVQLTIAPGEGVTQAWAIASLA